MDETHLKELLTTIIQWWISPLGQTEDDLKEKARVVLKELTEDL